MIFQYHILITDVPHHLDIAYARTAGLDSIVTFPVPKENTAKTARRSARVEMEPRVITEQVDNI